MKKKCPVCDKPAKVEMKNGRFARHFYTDSEQQRRPCPGSGRQS